MATHSSVLAWRIPWTEEPGGYSPRGRKESDTTERLSAHTHPTVPAVFVEKTLILSLVIIDQATAGSAGHRQTLPPAPPALTSQPASASRPARCADSRWP